MSEIQHLLSELLSRLAAARPFGIAFAAGMVAAVNPCGFAMLPAYFSLYFGTEESEFSERSAASRALAVDCVVSSGFVVLFGLAGLVISAGETALIEVMPVLGVLVGEALVVLGVWMLFAGRAPYTAVLGRLAAAGGSQEGRRTGFLSVRARLRGRLPRLHAASVLGGRGQRHRHPRLWPHRVHGAHFE